MILSILFFVLEKCGTYQIMVNGRTIYEAHTRSTKIFMQLVISLLKISHCKYGSISFVKVIKHLRAASFKLL